MFLSCDSSTKNLSPDFLTGLVQKMHDIASFDKQVEFMVKYNRRFNLVAIQIVTAKLQLASNFKCEIKDDFFLFGVNAFLNIGNCAHVECVYS